MRSCKFVLPLLLLFAGWGVAHAGSPTCTSPETKLSWPQTDPIWEMCWLPPSESVGGIGSGMEVRKVYFKGHLVFVRAHAPMLFAEYKDGQGGDCYRDWKNEDSALLADRAVQNKLGISVDPPAAIASCDRSTDPTASYEVCPYQLPGYPNATATCGAPFAIEDNGDHVVLTTQYRADWYMYASRWTFWNDGRIQPSFGFGNRNGTFNNVTHWHHNYWRMEFAIDDGTNTVSVNGVDKTTEFSDLRDATGGADGGPKTWEVRNPKTGNGYKVVPGEDDYLVPANQSGRGFHQVDVMATQQHDDEYADIVEPSDPWKVLGICNMEDGNLVNNESLVDTRPALYYRVAVRDSTANSWPPGCTGSGCIPQDSMVCKKVGPTLMPFGPWVGTTEPTDPIANVTPADVDVSLTEGTTATDLFGLGNTGAPGSTLTYTIDTAPSSCASPAAVAWLSATPASGSVAQGATTKVTASVDATTLAPGDYSAALCVRSNDPANPTIQVPVSVTVVPAAVGPCSANDTIFCDGFDDAGGGPFEQPVQDPSFEATTGDSEANPNWTGVDDNGGAGQTPFWTSASTTLVDGAHTGDFVAWGGGWGSASSQHWLQSVTIAGGGPRFLNFWRKVDQLPSGGTATLKVSVDGTEVSSLDLLTASVDADWVKVSIDVSSYADDAAHEIRFDFAATGSDDGDVYVDDVTIDETEGSRKR